MIVHSAEETDHDRPMRVSRRAILAGTAAGVVSRATAALAASSDIRAIAFDGFPIFDPRTVTARARALFPNQGDALTTLWANKLFAYTWIVTAADRYQTFEALADASLRVAAETMHLDLPDSARTQLVATYSQLDVWPDVKPALAKLKAAGVRLALLSNLTDAMLNGSMRHAGLDGVFDAVLSTDRVRRFKPAPAAYAMALDAFGLPKANIGFAAFGGWDAAGATWFGYRTAWIDRFAVPADRLDAKPEITTRGIEGVLALAGLS